MYRGKLAAICVGLALAMGSAPVLASDDADAAIKYRKNVMAAVGAHTKALVAILKGEVSNTDALALHASGLANATDTALTVAAFKQNTDGQGVEKTTSTAKIWDDFPRFEKSLTDLAAAAVEIEKSAAAGGLNGFDQLKPALKECGFCHRDSGFRDK